MVREEVVGLDGSLCWLMVSDGEGKKELKWAFLLAWNGSAVAGLVGAR